MVLTITPTWLIIIAVLGIWELIWKGIAMYKAARFKQDAWYIWILILNTAGILPIVYLLWFQKGRSR